MDNLIIKKHNPSASFDNALQLYEKDNLCCGEGCPEIVCQYVVQRDSDGDVTELVVAGQVFAFDAIPVTDKAALEAKVREILQGLGYGGGASCTWDADTQVLTVITDYSALVFEEFGGHDMTRTTCKIVGKFENPASCCDAQVVFTVRQDGEGTDIALVFTVTSLQPVTELTVLAVDADETLTVVNEGSGVYIVVLESVGVFDQQELLVTVSTQGCEDKTFEFDYEFEEEPDNG